MKQTAKLERIINGQPRLPVNKQTIIVTSKIPRSCPVAPTFAKRRAFTVVKTPGRDAAPPQGTWDHRGWTFGKLQVTGYALTQEYNGFRKRKVSDAPPSWWVGPGWYPKRGRVWRIERRHFWYCICLLCRREVKKPQSIHSLNKFEKNDVPCQACQEAAGHHRHRKLHAPERRQFFDGLIKKGRLVFASKQIVYATGD